jgi:N-carbamoylputrescine amidase
MKDIVKLGLLQTSCSADANANLKKTLALVERAAKQGAQILFYPTAIGWHPSEKKEYGAKQHSAWETIQRSHAVANGCYVAVANRIGREIISGEGIEFWGQSFVAGTSGEILAKAGTNKEEILVVPVDLNTVDVTRTHWPFLRDRRIDAYDNLTKRLVD